MEYIYFRHCMHALIYKYYTNIYMYRQQMYVCDVCGYAMPRANAEKMLSQIFKALQNHKNLKLSAFSLQSILTEDKAILSQ